MSKNKTELNFGNSEFKFFSFVGLQVMATLGPILSLYNSGIKLKKVFLFATNSTKNNTTSNGDNSKSSSSKGGSYNGSLNIKQYLEENNYGIDVEIIEIENNSTCVDKFIETFNRNLEEGDKNIFGSEGGQNAYLIPSFFKLRKYFDYLLIASGQKYKIVDVKDNSAVGLDYPCQLSAEKILQLQGVDFSFDSMSTNEDGSITYYNVAQCLESQKISLPNGHLKNVIIGGVHYDLVWPTKSNRLKMLCSSIKKSPSINVYNALDKDEKNKLNGIHNQYIRHLIASKDKSNTNGLYDKFLYVVTNISNDDVRVLKEGDSKKIASLYIKDLDASGDIKKKKFEKSNLQDDKTVSKYIAKAVKKEVFDKKEIFKQEISKESLEYAENYSKAIDVKSDSLIFVYSPNNPALPIRILNSFKKKNTVICCTPDVVKEVELFISSKKNPENFQIVVCNIEGTNINECFNSFEDPSTVACNATPGTKSQGLFLAQVALQNGCQIWVNQYAGHQKNSKDVMVRVDAKDESIELKAADFCEILNAADGEEYILSSDQNSNYNQEKGFFSEFLKFLSESDFSLSNFALAKRENHKNNIKYNNKNEPVFTYETENYILRGKVKLLENEDKKGNVQKSYWPGWTILNKKNNKQYFYQVEKGGEWLEVLVAQAVEDACKFLKEEGESHSRVRRARYANSSKENNMNQPFLADYDVLGQFDGSNFIISCKSWSKKSTKPEYVSPEAAAKEVKDIAKGFGKYTSSLLCHLECTQSCDINGVVVFGQKELSSPQLLVDALKRAKEKLHKVN